MTRVRSGRCGRQSAGCPCTRCFAIWRQACATRSSGHCRAGWISWCVIDNRDSASWLMSPAIVYIWGVGTFFASMMRMSLSEFAAYVAVGYLVFRFVNSAIVESNGTLAASAPFLLHGHSSEERRGGEEGVSQC